MIIARIQRKKTKGAPAPAPWDVPYRSRWECDVAHCGQDHPSPDVYKVDGATITIMDVDRMWGEDYLGMASPDPFVFDEIMYEAGYHKTSEHQTGACYEACWRNDYGRTRHTRIVPMLADDYALWRERYD